MAVVKVALLQMTACGNDQDANRSKGAEFDMDRIRACRERGAWGNAFRKPRSYGLLTSLQVEKPFIRESARR